ncbi:hypothetical protein LTR70_010436 [Exophiala xenobiotica]|uniref:Uncharacterized protein n=1 Tax=Lithohypha guttulata TaxID=1690604 RepID=A0ABR0JU26_9EURO|nr:hypothetical protein LTR24_010369 [Lithohypha guttulata]KAK5309274.1 hypothetical protein LTR70_010436 [Exophiala xenobiotica]
MSGINLVCDNLTRGKARDCELCCVIDPQYGLIEGRREETRARAENHDNALGPMQRAANAWPDDYNIRQELIVTLRRRNDCRKLVDEYDDQLDTIERKASDRQTAQVQTAARRYAYGNSPFYYYGSRELGADGNDQEGQVKPANFPPEEEIPLDAYPRRIVDRRPFVAPDFSLAQGLEEELEEYENQV